MATHEKTIRAFIPEDQNYEQRVRQSFARQGIMAHIGAELGRVEPGYCADNGSAVDPRGRYRFVPEYGMQRVAEGERGFDGEVLFQIAAGQFEGEALRVAKRLTRSALAPLLGDRPLRSRELFVAATGGGDRGELTK